MLVGNAYPVGIPVSGEAHVGTSLSDLDPQFGKVAGYGLRLTKPREQGVAGPMYLAHPCRGSAYNSLDVADARPVHRVHGHPQPRLPDPIQIDQCCDVAFVRGHEVHCLDKAISVRIFYVGLGHTTPLFYTGDYGFQGRGYLRSSASCVFRLEFKAVPSGRIVAGRNDYRPCRFPVHDCVAGDGGRHRRDAEIGWDAVGGKDSCRVGGEALGEEAGIVPDHHPPPPESPALNVFGNGLRADPDVGKGEIVGDKATPTVGTKFNLARHLPDCTPAERCRTIRGSYVC